MAAALRGELKDGDVIAFPGPQQAPARREAPEPNLVNRAVELMSLGLASLGDDYGDALLTVSRAIESQLVYALGKCRNPNFRD
ncbi:MAG: hypothetical protein JOZ72_00820 [Alphaproteobacteria bacterium]|nr:hypothetical protein [Alphaproteobacteria bacterium]